MNYLSSAYNDGNFQPKNYWSKSGASVILQNLLKIGAISSELSQKFNLITQDNEVNLSFDESTSLFGYEFVPGEYNEKIFSYLLVNSGYLTLKNENSKYFFRIPNYEVKKEFIEVIKNELYNTERLIHTQKDTAMLDILTEHQEILLKHIDILQYKDKMVDAFNIILTRDSVKLSKLFNTIDGLKCEDQSMNFNFFHIGAMVGDEDVFTTLMANCDKSLLSVKDKSQELKPIDYAYLLGNHNLMKQIEDITDNGISLQLPGVIDSTICAPIGGLYILYNLIAVSAITAALKTVLKAPGFKSAFYAIVATSAVKELTKYIGEDKFGLCDQYNNYAKIDISANTKLNSLKQLEKYALEHNNTYIAFNKLCNNEDKNIANLTVPMSNEYSQQMVFTLCEQPGQEKDSYYISDYILDSILISGALLSIIAIPLLGVKAFCGGEQVNELQL
jgi:hypothetical protein